MSNILAGKRNPKAEIWLKLLRAGQILEDKQQQVDHNTSVSLELIRKTCIQQSIRKLAKSAGIDPANLSHVLNGKRNLTI